VSAPCNNALYEPGLFESRPFAILPGKKVYQGTLAVLVKRPDPSVNGILMQGVTALGYLWEMGAKAV
jgi:hypothetical protein